MDNQPENSTSTSLNPSKTLEEIKAETKCSEMDKQPENSTSTMLTSPNPSKTLEEIKAETKCSEMDKQPENSTSTMLTSLNPSKTLEEIEAETKRLEAELKLRELQTRLKNLKRQEQLEAEKKATEKQNKAQKLEILKGRYVQAIDLWNASISTDEAAECAASHHRGYSSMQDGSYEREQCKKILLELAKENYSPAIEMLNRRFPGHNASCSLM